MVNYSFLDYIIFLHSKNHGNPTFETRLKIPPNIAGLIGMKHAVSSLKRSLIVILYWFLSVETTYNWETRRTNVRNELTRLIRNLLIKSPNNIFETNWMAWDFANISLIRMLKALSVNVCKS